MFIKPERVLAEEDPDLEKSEEEENEEAMEVFNLETGDVLIMDPCYIQEVKVDLKSKDNRFDALRTIEVLHDGDDGEFHVEFRGKTYQLGVDSGRIWAMQAEFPCVVRVKCGFSGYGLQRSQD